jgi:hypothetical protein
VGALLGGSSLGVQKEGSGDGHHCLVLGGLFIRNSEGQFAKGKSGNRASLSRGALLGNLEGGFSRGHES